MSRLRHHGNMPGTDSAVSQFRITAGAVRTVETDASR
jgi:hypothetical protein